MSSTREGRPRWAAGLPSRPASPPAFLLPTVLLYPSCPGGSAAPRTGLSKGHRRSGDAEDWRTTGVLGLGSPCFSVYRTLWYLLSLIAVSYILSLNGDFQNALREELNFFLCGPARAAGIDQHGLTRLFRPVLSPSPSCSELPLSSPPPALPPASFSARPFFKYTSKIPHGLVSDKISLLLSEEESFIFKMTTDLFFDMFSIQF